MISYTPCLTKITPFVFCFYYTLKKPLYFGSIFFSLDVNTKCPDNFGYLDIFA